MKKILAFMLAAVMALSLFGCSSVTGLDLPPLPTPIPTETPKPSETPEPTPEPISDELVNQVTVSIKKNSEPHYAPDDESQLILDFSYETPVVHIEGNDAAAIAINDFFSTLDDEYYTGNDYGSGASDGLNGMLEQALDNYQYVKETGADAKLEFVSSRSTDVTRSDSRIISFLLDSYVYAGDAQGLFTDMGYVFDAQTGELLKLEKITDDVQKLAGIAAAYMIELAQNEESYKQIIDAQDIDTALAALVRDGSWYFSEEGMVFFAGVYEIAPYSAGIVKFTVPYDKLTDALKAEYLPIPKQGSGELTVSDHDGSVEIIDKITESTDGIDVYLTASGTIYEVCAQLVTYADYGDYFMPTAELWHCSYMTDCAVQVQTLIPEGLPDVMISYTTGDGMRHRMLISQSGEDGSLILVDDSIRAVG